VLILYSYAEEINLSQISSQEYLNSRTSVLNGSIVPALVLIFIVVELCGNNMADILSKQRPALFRYPFTINLSWIAN